MFDLLIKGGIVVDGTGEPPRVADVAVTDGLITEVGAVSGTAREVFEADGAYVTPGFVDPHTHYDGQATWDPYLSPSSWHGVTTAVFGNCGVGFAPVRPGKEDWLISVMESVEDIPGSALSEGITWGWESFPQYLDVLEHVPHAIDVAAHVPHAAVRAYVMGERCTDEFDASDAELDEMAAIVRDSIAAGAVGFATSRTAGHMMLDGRPIPGTGAADREVLALAAAARGAVVQLVPAGESGGMPSPNPETSRMERELIDAVARTSGARVTFSVLQDSTDPDNWRADFDMARRAQRDGFTVRPQVGGRCFGVLMGLQCKLNPLRWRPAYQSIAHLPLAERVAALRDPAMRAAILADRGPRPDGPAMDYLSRYTYGQLYALGRDPDYEPTPDLSVAAIAARTGQDPFEVVYDMLLRDDGKELLLFPMLNYSGGGYDGLLEMMTDPISLQGLSDGGAHCSMICDASIPTYMLSHWVRDRTRGARMPIEYAIKRLAAEPSRHYGFHDRGVLRPGLRADFNVIDLDSIGMGRPEQVADLPAGERRFVQRAHGYIATGVAGKVILRDGETTGELPGRLVRAGAR